MIDLLSIILSLSFEFLKIVFSDYRRLMSAPYLLEADAKHYPIEKDYFREVVNPLVKSLHVINRLYLAQTLLIQSPTVHEHLALVKSITEKYKALIPIGPGGGVLRFC